MKRVLLYLIIATAVFSHKAKAQNLYFPPLSHTAAWDSLSPSSLGWCVNEIDTLYNFLQQENTKGFVVLKDGKIVLEKYFGTFTKDSLWYWASAGKTITSFLIGKAQEEGLLSISDSTSAYLGQGWTACTTAQENKIKIRNQLTMTTGLDDAVPDNHCTLDSCLVYLADAGTRWAYHNAPYTLLEDVITVSTSQTANAYTQSKLKTLTGMTGGWFMSGYDNVYASQVRSMARFGLLIQNKCVWDGDTLLYDTAYINQMTNTSQSMNYSYGYLWWLNGKASFMIPGSQLVFPGSWAPNAPNDMFAALGKNGQILCISRSTGLVVVRMGNPPTNFGEVPVLFCDQMWAKLNDVMCSSSSIHRNNNPSSAISICPNPVTNSCTLSLDQEYPQLNIQIYNIFGNKVQELNPGNTRHVEINLSTLPAGIYYLNLNTNNTHYTQKLLKINK
jgi:CubicO group peptidase (beta-lactamase class C family)